MPQPYWIFFLLAIALVAAFEWEEFNLGFAPVTAFGRMCSVLAPAVYTAIAAYIFLLSPLAFAGAIRHWATAECTEHRAFDDSNVRVVYAGYHTRSGGVTNGPNKDEIHLVCNDATQIRGRYRDGIIETIPAGDE